MLGVVIVLIATLFQVEGFNSTKEIITVMFIFTSMAFIYNMSLYLKILSTHNDQPHELKNALRPLILLMVIIIRALTV